MPSACWGELEMQTPGCHFCACRKSSGVHIGMELDFSLLRDLSHLESMHRAVLQGEICLPIHSCHAEESEASFKPTAEHLHCCPPVYDGVQASRAGQAKARAEDASSAMVTTAGCSLRARHHPCHRRESPFHSLAPQTCLLLLWQERKIVARLCAARRDPGGMTVLGSRR